MQNTESKATVFDAESHLIQRRKEWEWAAKAEQAFLADPTEANFGAALQGLRLGLWTELDFEACRVLDSHSSETPQIKQDVS
jgi:hypothetical protein